MATINCPHCGKEMYEMLTECPNCGGPVVSEALESEINGQIDELVEKVNKKEKTALVICTIVAVGMASMTLSSGGKGVLISIVVMIIASIMMSPIFYGLYRVHPIKRFMRYGLPICFILTILSLYVSVLGYAYYPKALISIIKKKPILSREEVMKLHEKDLV